MIIFTYAPAGLGHLRVTDALYEGLPHEASPLLLGSQAKAIAMIHRIMSVHPLMRRLFEWGQTGPFQDLITRVYRWQIRSQRSLLFQQVMTLLDQRVEVPKTVLIVATHYGLAHQAAAIKDEIAEARGVQVFVIVQVTDDSPQYIWLVSGADLTMVPSAYTRDGLMTYAKETGLTPGEIAVSAYPLSPKLNQPLDKKATFARRHQLNPEGTSQIHLSIPISGAAVGLDYITDLVDHMHRLSSRLVFHIVSRSAPYTLFFLRDMIERSFVRLYVSEHDREVVNLYEEIFHRHTIALEITKPSEQAFKALLRPDQVGGVVLLFAEPVGRQEYENIAFLQRHGLIPHPGENHDLWEMAERNADLTDTKRGTELRTMAREWRGLILPPSAERSACFISWCHQQALFLEMMRFTRQPDRTDQTEVHSHGVRAFWDQVARTVQSADDHCF